MPINDTERELLDLERTYWEAMKNRDVEAAKALTDFPCVISGAQGARAIDEKTFTRMMTDPSYSIEGFELNDDATVRFVADGVAVVGYRVHEKVSIDGKPLELDASESSTWVKRDGHWACALHAEALSGDPFGRDRGQANAKEGPHSEVAEARAIRELIAKWVRASEAHDVPTLLGLMTDDAVFQQPGEAPFGKEEFAAFAGGVRANRIDSVSAEIEELEIKGDFAFARTHLVIDITPPNGVMTRRAGHGLTIYEKAANGKWKLARDCTTLLEQTI